jgi:hypothetical protein
MDEATQLLQKINTIVERYEAQKRINASDFNIFSITGIAKLQSIQEDLDGKFELIEADIANAEASIMDSIDECTNS